MAVRDCLGYLNWFEKPHPLWAAPFPGSNTGSVWKGAEQQQVFIALGVQISFIPGVSEQQIDN